MEKDWKKPEVKNLNISNTEKNNNKGGNNGNNDTHEHKGWCEMHKHPENGICTCGKVKNPS